MTNRFYNFIVLNLIYFHIKNYINTSILLDQLTIDIKLKE